MPVYDEKLISPFAVRFSQDRIRPTFQDKYPVQDSLDEIGVIETEAGTSIGQRYDVLLDAPFPMIEVIRWKPKMRNQDGSALEDAHGEVIYGDACWFTLDNRRLYCLQCAAMRCWPKRAAAAIRVVDTKLRSNVLKFQTTTSGRCVLISRRYDPALGTWDWVEATRSKQGDPTKVMATLFAVKADSDTPTLEGLCAAPEPGPVRQEAIQRDSAVQTDGHTIHPPAAVKVPVSRLFQLASSPAREEPLPDQGQQLMSILQPGVLDSGVLQPAACSSAPTCVDWSSLLKTAADAGESVQQAKLGSLLRKAGGGDGSGWSAAAGSWDGAGTWDASTWEADPWDSSAAWQEEGDAAWEEDAAWEGEGWAGSEEAAWKIRSISGEWLGAKGESYTVDDHEWRVVRADNHGTKRYTLNWDENMKVIRWGDQFYLAHVDEHEGLATWAHLKSSHRNWVWTRQ